ncbi:hypothetical protein Tco_0530118 [Tanacetum coccineum]
MAFNYLTSTLIDFSKWFYGEEHPSDTISIHNEDGNPSRRTIKHALGIGDSEHPLEVKLVTNGRIRLVGVFSTGITHSVLCLVETLGMRKASALRHLSRIDGSSCLDKDMSFTTPCSHFIFLIKDIMITERLTTSFRT